MFSIKTDHCFSQTMKNIFKSNRLRRVFVINKVQEPKRFSSVELFFSPGRHRSREINTVIKIFHTHTHTFYTSPDLVLVKSLDLFQNSSFASLCLCNQTPPPVIITH